MARSSVLSVIRPITGLRTHMNEVCSQATETKEPIVLIKNGSAAYVLMDGISGFLARVTFFDPIAVVVVSAESFVLS